MGRMDRALDGIELEYEIRGAGEPVVLVHHVLHLQNPSGMADGLAAFFARHPFLAALPDKHSRWFKELMAARRACAAHPRARCSTRYAGPRK